MRFLINFGGTAALALTALAFGRTAVAQYAPYGQTASPQYYQAYPQPQPYGGVPQYYARQAPVYGSPAPAYAAGGQRYVPAPVVSQPSVPYTAMAYPYQVAQADDNLSLTPPVESVPPGTLQTPPPGAAPAPVPMPEYSQGQMPPFQGPGPAHQQPMPYDNYGSGGCATGNGAPSGYGIGGYGACDTSGYGYGACNGGGYSNYGGSMGHLLNKHCGCGYWFGGVYGLLMDRDNSNKYPLVFTGDNNPPTPYYPSPSQVVLTTRGTDIGYQGGVEFRIGRTFGCGPVGGCDPCGGYGGGCDMGGGCDSCNTCAPCPMPCGPRWGLEAVYWQIFDDYETALYVDNGTIRTYSMMPMFGLEADMGNGYIPVNDYYDYGPPVNSSNTIRVTLARVRSDFEVRNLELNLLRLSCCGGGFGYGGGYNMAAGYGAVGGGCGGGGCGVCCGPRYQCTGVCGIRYMEFDERFMFGVDVDNTGTGYPAPATGFIDYHAQTQNNLLGAQIGCNGLYRVGCKWGLNLSSAVGIYGNDITVRQYFDTPTDLVRIIGTGENFDAYANKTDVAMIGELRMGVSYQATCRMQLYGGYRVLGVTGIALATDQFPTAVLSAGQMANYVNSNGSLILHGVQAGVQWNY